MSEMTSDILGGRYQLRRHVARGGMTDVFLGYDTLLSRSVAIKRLFPEFATDLSFVERFRREATAAANLNHPNIVEVYDWVSDAGTHFLVLEYIEGKSLAELIATSGPFIADRAAEIALSVAAALGFAHSNGMIHRDVKPGNVLIASDGKTKVTDFGIAIAALDTADSNLTKMGSVMGTATYFSPEQAKGESLDHRSDLYSLGVVLYEMLCGRPPFVGESSVAVAYKHVQEAVPWPTHKGIVLPESLEAINMKLLAKDPASRYPTAMDLQRDLNRYMEGEHQRNQRNKSVPTAVDQPPRPSLAKPTLPAQPAKTGQLEQPEQLAQPADEPNTSRADIEASSRVGLFVAAAVAFVAIAVLLFFVLSNMLGTESDSPPVVAPTPVLQVELPDVVGVSGDVAINQLRTMGLMVSQATEISPNVPAGQVISQNPVATTDVDVGSQVVLTISSGPAPVMVPGVVGEMARDATRFLQDRGLVVELVVDEESNAPEGQVIRQDPTSGTDIAPGASVVLYVAGGPAAIEVPVVAEMTPLRATQVLTQAGFEVSEDLQEQTSEEIQEGLVITTDPAPPALLFEDTSIQLVVSIGPQTVEVPSLLGMTTSAAVATLNELDLVLSARVTVCNLEDLVPAPEAAIVGQTPLPGEQHPFGTEVIVCVGIEPVVQPVPSPANELSGVTPATTDRQIAARNAASDINAQSIAAARQADALGTIQKWTALDLRFAAECRQLETTFADIDGISALWNLEPPYPMPASAANALNWIEGINGDTPGKDDGCVVTWN
ncbi:MAG: Stk1 family PASTA domain-containing Ser/Thr kinase [bacterium]|nr:Stk1 family PASTA domain-containing Ser/Thr kinase [bacterium]